jgi:hypothetical protein
VSEPKYHFAPGEARFVWLDENDERTSPYCKTIPSAYRYREALARHLDGQGVWSPASRKPFEPQGSGLPAVRLAKLVMTHQEQSLTKEEALDVKAVERLTKIPL